LEGRERREGRGRHGWKKITSKRGQLDLDTVTL